MMIRHGDRFLYNGKEYIRLERIKYKHYARDDKHTYRVVNEDGKLEALRLDPDVIRGSVDGKDI